MPRIAGVVLPGLPHHVTRRGNRRVDVFCHKADRRRMRTDRPCGSAGFIEHLESGRGRILRPHKRGPKPKKGPRKS